MNLLLGLVGIALAGAPEDVAIASSKDAPEATRMEAFERLVTLGATDMKLVSLLAQDEDASARERWVAIRTLGKIGGDRSRNILGTLLDNPQPAMRAAAASAVGDMGDTEFVGKLCVLVDDPAVIVRAAAAGALGTLGQSEAVPHLSDAIEDKKSTFRGQAPWVRKHYVVALGAIGHTSAYPALLRTLDDGDPEVASLTLGALEKVAGFSYAKGRSKKQEREAWRRHISNELR